MINQFVSDHIDRVRTAVLKRYTMEMMSKWITDNTTLGGEPYSYKDHEFQEVILNDTSVGVNVRKCSQVGVSEVSVRLALAAVGMLSPFTSIYTLPTYHFAGTFTKTRIDPIIDGSRVLKAAIHRTTDNNEIKRFGDSYLYVKGAASASAPLSIPADMLVHDEVDVSDQELLATYVSRLTHSKWKLIRRFSTPTLPNFGIDKAFQGSRRFFNLCCCHHCNHWFLPDYYEHVKIPGFTGDLHEITKSNLGKLRWEEAFVACPKCGLAPDLGPNRRRYVCENADSGLIEAGYQVSPFDAPAIIKPSYLVRASTMYERNQDFVNQNLGLPAEDSEATLTRGDMNPLFTPSLPGSNMAYVMGVDVGNVYHFVVAGIDGYGDMLVVHTEQVPMGRARSRYAELRAQYRVVCAVIDSGPHAETVMALQNQDPTLYASVYTRSKGMLTHTVIDKDQVKDEGQEFVRQVNVNRSRAFDAYMNYLRENHLAIRCDSDELRETIITHHISMKRVKVFDSESGELSYSWQKTDGEDHFHHAFLYCWIAGRIKGVGRPLHIIGTTSVTAFRSRGGW